MTEDIEKSVLSSVMFAGTFNDRSQIKDVELNEEYFGNYFHKAVAKVINALRSKGKPTDELTVSFYLQKNNLFHEQNFLAILTANPFGSLSSVNHYIGVLKEHSVKSKWMNI